MTAPSKCSGADTAGGGEDMHGRSRGRDEVTVNGNGPCILWADFFLV